MEAWVAMTTSHVWTFAQDDLFRSAHLLENSEYLGTEPRMRAWHKISWYPGPRESVFAAKRIVDAISYSF